MFHDEVKVGATVWAQAGSYGWRPAVVTKIGKPQMGDTRISVRFESGSAGNGTRRPRELEPRNPALKGKDKPKPMWKQEAEMQEAQERADEEIFWDELEEEANGNA